MKPEVGKSVDYSELGPVPGGAYECVVKSYKVIDNPFFHPKPYTSEKAVTKNNKVYQPGEVIPADPPYLEKQYQFVFEIVEGDNKGRWLFKRTGTMLTSNERNHMYQMFSKIVEPDLLDAMIADGDAPDIDDDIVGQPIVVFTTIVSGKKGKANKIVGFERSQLTPSNEEEEVQEEIQVVSIDELGEEIPF